MTFSSGGVAFRVELPNAPLLGEMGLLEGMPGARDDRDPFLITVDGNETRPLGTLDPSELAPADIESDGGAIRLRHPLFEAHVDPVARRATVTRIGGGGFALAHTLRIALLSVLPLENALAVHSCAAALDGRALLFHGRSGAGKTTLANTCPWTLLSDEIVVLRHEPSGWYAHPSGFWGGARPKTPVADAPAALAALVALDKGASYELSPLSERETLRALTASVHVPPTREHWRLTLPLLEELAHSVRSVRMAWSPTAPPWGELKTLLQNN